MPYTFTMNTNPFHVRIEQNAWIWIENSRRFYQNIAGRETRSIYNVYKVATCAKRFHWIIYVYTCVSSPLDNVLSKYRNRNTDCITKTRANIWTKLSTANIYADSSMCAIATNIENFNRFNRFTLQYYQIKMPAYDLDTFDTELKKKWNKMWFREKSMFTKKRQNNTWRIVFHLQITLFFMFYNCNEEYFVSWFQIFFFRFILIPFSCGV